VEALIFSTNARNEDELAERCDRPQLRALVTNRIASLSSEEKNLLTPHYPGTDFDTCLIIQEGREPAGAGKLWLLLGGGGLLSVVGAALLVKNLAAA
jgi:hypothetical protein